MQGLQGTTKRNAKGDSRMTIDDEELDLYETHTHCTHDCEDIDECDVFCHCGHLCCNHDYWSGICTDPSCDREQFEDSDEDC